MDDSSLFLSKSIKYRKVNTDIIKIEYINSYIPDCDCFPQTTEEPIYVKPGEKYVMKKNFYSDNLDPDVNPDPKPD